MSVEQEKCTRTPGMTARSCTSGTITGANCFLQQWQCKIVLGKLISEGYEGLSLLKKVSSVTRETSLSLPTEDLCVFCYDWPPGQKLLVFACRLEHTEQCLRLRTHVGPLSQCPWMSVWVWMCPPAQLPLQWGTCGLLPGHRKGCRTAHHCGV